MAVSNLRFGVEAKLTRGCEARERCLGRRSLRTVLVMCASGMGRLELWSEWLVLARGSSVLLAWSGSELGRRNKSSA